MHKTNISRKLLSIIAIAEGASYLLLLFVTMPLKYILGWLTPNVVVGMLHGVLFMLYIVIVLYWIVEHKWPFKKSILALIASVIPFGTFWADAQLFRKA